MPKERSSIMKWTPGFRGAVIAWAAAAVLSAQGCSATPTSSEAATRSASGTSPASIPASEVVVLGDSIPTTNGCTGCTGFPDLFGRTIERRTGSPVNVTNLAVPGSGVGDLLGQLRQDTPTQEALADADVVVVTIGFNDTPWGRADDPCHVGADFPVILWDQITDQCITEVTADYAKKLDATLTALEELQPSGSVLRVVGVYNSVLGDHVDPSWDSPEAVAPSVASNAAFVEVQREAAEQHGGVYVDMLKRMNGPLGRREARKYLAADYTHLNQRGHELTASALAQSGWEQ
jgi:lysophospholipase L1-like esterase